MISPPHGVQERVEALHGVQAAGLNGQAPLGLRPVLVGLGGLQQLVRGGGRLRDTGLAGEVGAVEEDASVDVPGHAVRLAVVRGLLPGGGEEVVLLDGLGVDRLEDAHVGELAEVGPAHLHDVGQLASGGRGDELLVRHVPADRGHLDGDVRVGLLVDVGDLGELLALGAHGPDGERLLGIGVHVRATGAATGGEGERGRHSEGDRGRCGAVHGLLLLERS